MILDNKILIGCSETPVYLLPKMANRHGLITGATGTGKTTTLKVLAEGFSDLGVPVILADVKGDVSSLAVAGEKNEKVISRLADMGIDAENYSPESYPCRFWDVYQKNGIPVRATISEVGPVLLSRLLNLTEVQAGVLNIAFHVADDNDLPMDDLKDLQAMLVFLSEHKSEITVTYGNVTTQTIGAIQRALLTLKDQGGDLFFGKPVMNLEALVNGIAPDGRGIINILHCTELVQQPLLYATVLFWMLGDLYESLPEVGDPEKPRLVFFFDEAHMLFGDAPKALTDKIIQIVKLIRSKGIGIYFISQSPADIPDAVLAQLNNRIQHALHAYTPAEAKAVMIAAQSFRPNPKFKTEEMIATMGTGIALVSTLDESGAPSIVEKTTIAPPCSSFSPLDATSRMLQIGGDPVYTLYEKLVDDISAYEILMGQKEDEEQERQAALEAMEAEKARIAEEKEAEKAAKEAEKARIAEEKARIAEEKAAEKAEREAERARIAEEKAAEKALKDAERAAKAAEREAAAQERAAQKALQEQYKAEGRDRYGRTKVQAYMEKAAKNTAKSIGRSAAKSVTRGVLGNNKTVNKYAGQMAGNVVSDLIGSFFR